MGQLTLQYGPLAHDFRRPYILMKFEKPNLKTSYLSKMYSRKTKLTNWAIMWLIFWMNRFIMFLQFTFLRLSMITDRDLVNIFSVQTGSCSLILKLTISKKNHGHNFGKFYYILSLWKKMTCLSKMSLLEELNSQFEQLCHLSVEWTDSWCFHISFFFENKHDHRWRSILSMNWISMHFHIDFFIKIIVTTLASFVTSCP